MISAAEIRAARERAGLTQQELGAAVGVGLRTIGNWERGETVPRNREARLRHVLAEHLTDTHASPLRAVSDAEVVAEVARRMSTAREERETYEHRDAPATTQARGSLATEEVIATVTEALETYFARANIILRTQRGRDRDALLDELRTELRHDLSRRLAAERPDSARDVG